MDVLADLYDGDAHHLEELDAVCVLLLGHPHLALVVLESILLQEKNGQARRLCQLSSV